MPLNDEYGQEVSYPLLTDGPPNVQSAFSGVVNGIVPKINMTFASASVRGAVVTNPTAGMVSWLQDVTRMEVYDGSAWVAFAVGTSLWTDIPLSPGYTDPDDSSNNFQGPLQYRVVNFSGVDALMFRGGVHIEYVGGSLPSPESSGGRVNQQALPASVRPAYRRTISLACSATDSTTSSVKLDVNPTGTLILVGLNDAKDSPPWVSFNGAICPL